MKKSILHVIITVFVLSAASAKAEYQAQIQVLASALMSSGQSWKLNSHDGLSLLKEYAEAKYTKAAAEITFVPDALTIEIGNSSIGILKSDIAAENVRNFLDPSPIRELFLSRPEQDKLIEQHRSNAEKFATELVGAGALIGYDSLARDECGRPIADLLIIDTQEGRIVEIPLDDCGL